MAPPINRPRQPNSPIMAPPMNRPRQPDSPIMAPPTKPTESNSSIMAPPLSNPSQQPLRGPAPPTKNPVKPDGPTIPEPKPSVDQPFSGIPAKKGRLTTDPGEGMVLDPKSSMNEVPTPARPVPSSVAVPTLAVPPQAARPETLRRQVVPPAQVPPPKVPRIPRDVYPPFAEPAHEGASRVPAPTRYRPFRQRHARRTVPTPVRAVTKPVPDQYLLSSKPVLATFSQNIDQPGSVDQPNSMNSMERTGGQRAVQTSWNGMGTVPASGDVAPATSGTANDAIPPSENGWIRLSDQ
jgi:hypothetical protein